MICRDSSVGIALGYGLDDRGSRVRFPAGISILFTTASRTALGPTQPPIQWVPGALSLRLKRPWREADHSPPSSAEVKELAEPYIHSTNTPSWRGAQLKHRDIFAFPFDTLYCIITDTEFIMVGFNYRNETVCRSQIEDYVTCFFSICMAY
jgi:hypothetical protein